MKTAITTIVILAISLNLYCQKISHYSPIGTTEKINFDTTIIAILPLSKNEFLFKNANEINLTQSELILADSLITACIEKNNLHIGTTKSRHEYIILPLYKRQYVPFLDNNERKIFINCLYQTIEKSSFFQNWKHSLISVDGGGRNFFSVIINLTTKRYYDLWINAPI